MSTASQPEELATGEDAALDRVVDDLAAGAAAWARSDPEQRADLLERTRASVERHARAWADAAIAAKGTPEALAGEEWLTGPYAALANLEALVHTFRALADGRSPLDGVPTGEAPGGRTTVQVLPGSLQDLVLFSGFSAEIWLRPGVSAEEARQRAGLGARRVGENGGVGLVLGAGNISSIGPLDVVYELVAANRAGVLKLNPTFASLLPVMEDAFEPLLDAGLMRVVNGGAAVGGYLAHHDGIGHVHITGSAATHDAIVWGVGEEASRRRAARDPRLTKEITSELGGVSPIIVVPGRWSEADLRYQAEHVATMRLYNSGHNCIAGQALVLSRDWDQRERFLEVLREVLTELPARDPWYPGSEVRLAAACESYPGAERIGGRLLVAVDETTSQDLLSTEYFGPVLGHTALPGTGAGFLRAAVEFANERLDGTLGANVIVAPAERRAMGMRFRELLGELRYGTVAVNAWTGMGFLLPVLPWGAFPGHTIEEVGSGIGIVHNAHLIEDTERAVVAGPFRPFPRSVLGRELSLSPKPPWFLTHRSGVPAAERLTSYAAGPAWRKLPGVVRHAFRS